MEARSPLTGRSSARSSQYPPDWEGCNLIATRPLDCPDASRPPLVVAKTDVNVRREAIAVLLATKWVRSVGVTVENLDEAEANEDDFDACMTAAALLRCVLEKSLLCPSDIN